MSNEAEAAGAIAQKRLIQRFRQAGAVSPQTARTLEEIGVWDSGQFRRLNKGRVLLKTQEGGYFLDEEAWQTYRGRKRGFLFGFVILAVIVVVAAYLIFEFLLNSPAS
jgi:2-polyprenyl-6-methoxyphenol hydroxylase-like FAD-dependent oxidoreductase